MAYAVGLAAAVWGELSDHAWLVPPAAVLGGLGYAAAGRLWWRRYRSDPTAPTVADSPAALALTGLVAIAALVVLVLAR